MLATVRASNSASVDITPGDLIRIMWFYPDKEVVCMCLALKRMKNFNEITVMGKEKHAIGQYVAAFKLK